MSTEEEKIREQGLKDFNALNAARGLIPLLAGELESKDVPKMHKDYLTNIIAGLVEDNKRLKQQVKSLEELEDENRKEYEKFYDKNARLIETYEAIKRLVP